MNKSVTTGRNETLLLLLLSPWSESLSYDAAAAATVCGCGDNKRLQALWIVNAPSPHNDPSRDGYSFLGPFSARPLKKKKNSRVQSAAARNFTFFSDSLGGEKEKWGGTCRLGQLMSDSSLSLSLPSCANFENPHQGASLQSVRICPFSILHPNFLNEVSC